MRATHGQRRAWSRARGGGGWRLATAVARGRRGPGYVPTGRGGLAMSVPQGGTSSRRAPGAQRSEWKHCGQIWRIAPPRSRLPHFKFAILSRESRSAVAPRSGLARGMIKTVVRAPGSHPLLGVMGLVPAGVGAVVCRAPPRGATPGRPGTFYAPPRRADAPGVDATLRHGFWLRPAASRRQLAAPPAASRRRLGPHPGSPRQRGYRGGAWGRATLF